MTPLASKREELAAKQKHLHAILAEAKTDNAQVIDLSKVTLIDGDNKHKGDEIKRLDAELSGLAMEVELFQVQAKNDELGKKLNDAVSGPIQPAGNGFGPNYGKSLGQMFVDSPAYKQRNRSGGPATLLEDVNPKDILSNVEVKTTMTTSAGYAPQAIRSGVIVPNALRPVQILDVIPMSETTQANVVFMEETTATNAAVETTEGSAYVADTFAFTERTSNVRKIASFLPVTDEQLDDAPQILDYINNRLVFFLRQRLDLQVLSGNGTPPNLTGLLNVGSIQTQAKGADPVPDAIYKAMVKVRITGRAYPSAVLLHPTDWQNIRLLRTAEGVYIWGNPADSGPERIWGLPIAQTDAGSAGTAVVADFANFTSLAFRKGVEVQVGYINDDFKLGLKSLRADMRVAFVVYRAAAICSVTGL